MAKAMPLVAYSNNKKNTSIMAKEKAHCKQIVKEFVRDNFPDTVAAMLSGSVADGNSNETSDIDAVLFSNWHKGAFVDNYEYKGENVQVIMLPIMNMGNLIHHELCESNGAILSIMAKGEYVCGDEGLCERASAVAKAILRKGRPQNTRRTETLRTQLTSAYEDVVGCDNPDELAFTMIKAYARAQRLHFDLRGTWDFSGKTAVRECRGKDDGFVKDYTASLHSFFATGDKSHAERFLLSVLEEGGDPVQYRTAQSMSETTDNPDFVAFLPKSSDDRERAALFADDVFRFCRRQCPDTLMVKVYIDADDIFRQGFYIVAHDSVSLLNGKLLPLLCAHISSMVAAQTDIAHCAWSFPYHQNPLAGALPQSVYLAKLRTLATIARRGLTTDDYATDTEVARAMAELRKAARAADMGNEIAPQATTPDGREAIVTLSLQRDIAKQDAAKCNKTAMRA